MTTTAYPTVKVEHESHGDWEVEFPEAGSVRCQTLNDALRVAYREAARQSPCELVVYDAYHRVARYELLDRR